MADNYKVEVIGSKIAEIFYLKNHLEKQTSSDDVLLVGERIATEGILQTVLERPFNSCVCTDIMPMGAGSPLDNLIRTDNRISFVQGDFIEFDETKKYQYIACINVLEHFGMNFAEFSGFSGVLAGDDYIRWNHDLRAIEKMIKLLSDDEDAKIIITVPAGQPICSGDLNPGNRMPFLRRYDVARIDLIEQLVKYLNVDMKSTYYYSENFTDWYETDSSITRPESFSATNPFSPNAIWAFTITKKRS